MRDDVHGQLLSALDGKLPPEVLDTWIRPVRVLEAHETRVELSVPNKFFRQQLEQRYLEPLRVAVASVDYRLGPEHVLASTALPGMPPTVIDNQRYGGSAVSVDRWS